MNWHVASAIVVSVVTLGTPLCLQAASISCDGVEALLTTPDVPTGSSIQVEVTVRDDLLGKVGGAVQFVGEQGPSSILTSTYQTFSAPKTTLTLKTKPTTVVSNYKGTLLGVVNGAQCDERVVGALDLYAP
ncbi:hypothetical protein [Pseudomonas sp. KCJK9016]|uniref:hypothetical protein n=1 Tax=Pseudomonas sp. KCJK9016 TaxID=3344556 RepID=UPI003906A5D8